MPRCKLLVAALLVLIAAVLQLKIMNAFYYTADFVLGTLIALSFFLSVEELILMTVGGAWLINWGVLSKELLFFAAIPILFLAIRKIFPWQSWFQNVVSILAGISIFYFAADFLLALQKLNIVFGDALVSAVFGTIVFGIFSNLNARSKSR